MTQYIQKIRSKIGHDHFIHPAARILIENEKGQFLMVKRADNDLWGIPSGSMEEDETIQQCIIREVYEETNIIIENPILIGISSNPHRETVTYPNGDVIQYFTIEFYCNRWKGKVQVQDIDEILEAKWLNTTFLEKLPENEAFILKSWKHFQRFRHALVS